MRERERRGGRSRCVYRLCWARSMIVWDLKGISSTIRPNLSPIHLDPWYHQPPRSLLIKDKRDPQKFLRWPAANTTRSISASQADTQCDTQLCRMCKCDTTESLNCLKHQDEKTLWKYVFWRADKCTLETFDEPCEPDLNFSSFLTSSLHKCIFKI